MAQSQPRQGIPTKLSKAQFEQFILPHLSKGRRGPATTLSFHAIFNYILHLLYLGCQWQHLPIEKDGHGRREIHPTSLYRTFRRWQAEGCFDLIFEGSVRKLHQVAPLVAAAVDLHASGFSRLTAASSRWQCRGQIQMSGVCV
jgi:transposase